MHTDRTDEIITLLRKIEENTRPAPLWVRGGVFLFTNALTIVGVLGMAYLSWQIWQVLGGVSTQMDSIIDAVTSSFGSLPFLR